MVSRIPLGSALACALVTTALAARADTGDVVAAEALFRSGKDLLAHQDYTRACPKLAESYRRDPATGTLLALAICHERQGKFASAWGEYSDVASRSRLEGRADREKAARAKADELEPRVSTLTILLADGAAMPGLVIRRNGVVVAPAWMGTPLPVDGGTESLEAHAPGKKTWHVDLAIAAAGDRQTVGIPPLPDEPPADAETRPPAPSQPPPPPQPPAAAAPPAPAPVSAAPIVAAAAPAEAPAAPAPDEAPARGLTPVQVAGVVVLVAGAAGLGIGSFFGIRALNKNSASSGECDSNNDCTPTGAQERSDAVAAGNASTVAFVSGGAVAAVGAAMVFLGRGAPRADTAHTLVRAYPVADTHGVYGVLEGRF